jgi:ankyrin repeat protein
MPADNELHKAANKGDIETCQKLIETPDEGEEKIDVNEPGASDRTALHRAAGAGHLGLCEYLLSVGAKIEAVSTSRFWFYRVFTVYVQVDKQGRTPLHWAAIPGHTDIVKLLLDKGADILAVTTSNMNALHGACEGGRVETVRVLMTHVSGDEAKKTALTNAKNSDDKTSWDIAFASKNKALCQVLKDMGDTNGASSSCVIS